MGHGSNSSHQSTKECALMNDNEKEAVTEFLAFAKWVCLCLLVAGGIISSGALGLGI